MNNNKATLEEVRSILKELSISQKELSASQKETDRQMQETDRQIQKIGGRFNQRWGAFIESLVEGNLLKLLQARGVDVIYTHSRTVCPWIKADGSTQTREFDIIAVNGKELVVVEVKTTLSKQDTKEFLETLRDFKHYLPSYKDKILYGSVAYLNKEDGADSFAEQQGLFVIRATGDSSEITNKKDFEPKSFS